MEIPFRGKKLCLTFESSPFKETKLRLHEDNLIISVSSLYRTPNDISCHLAEKVTDWLKSQARLAFCREVERQREIYGFKYKDVSLKDTKSRWGSCSSKGNLNFSWRLILAAPEALIYLVTHETAHLSEMNHSQKFWKLVADRSPFYDGIKTYLKNEGGAILKWELLPQAFINDINNICK